MISQFVQTYCFKNTLLILASVFIISCGTSNETGHSTLSQSEKELIPYKIDDKVTFSFSDSVDFQLKVTSRISTMEKDLYENVGELSKSDYINNEVEETTLYSSNPKMKFTITLDADKKKIDKNKLKVFKITFNEINRFEIFYDSIELRSNSNNTLLDSIKINNIVYHSVYRSINSSYSGDAKTLHPQYLFYNKKNGVLRLQLSNDKNYDFKN